MRVAMYLRVASAEQLEDTLQQQEDFLRQVALDKGDEVTLTVKEQGSGLDYCRPGLRELEEKTELYDAILMREISRIGRDPIKTYEWIKKMRVQDKYVIFSNGEEAINPLDQFLETSFKLK